jgi:hypothetical protein
MFKTVLASFINPQHELCLLAKEIDWASLQKEFAPLYREVGRPSIPIRTIVGLLLLKQIYNLGDETVMERYIDSPYCQHFCGEIYFQYKYPFDPSDFVHFRKRIRESGMKKIFKQSIDLLEKENVRKEVKEVWVDTTVQEKNITFPTDRGIIVGSMTIEGNAYDGHTLKQQLDQLKELTGGRIRKAIVDRGYQVKGGIRGVDIVMPKNLKQESYYLKKKKEERCRSRAGIEGLISHLKHDHRMIRNYLSGTAGDQINTFLAATAYNMRKWMRLKRAEILSLILRWIYQTPILVPVNIPR